MLLPPCWDVKLIGPLLVEQWLAEKPQLLWVPFPFIQFPQIPPAARDEPSVVLDVGVAWKGEGKACTEVLEPWGGRESPGMQGGIGSHELLVSRAQARGLVEPGPSCPAWLSSEFINIGA